MHCGKLFLAWEGINEQIVVCVFSRGSLFANIFFPFRFAFSTETSLGLLSAENADGIQANVEGAPQLIPSGCDSAAPSGVV